MCRNEKEQTLDPSICEWEECSPQSFTHYSFNTLFIMRTFSEIGNIVGVEINDDLKERNRTKRDGYPLTTGFRLVVQFSVGDELTEKERELLARIKDESARKQMERDILSHRRKETYSNVFNVEDTLKTKSGEPFVTPDGGFDDATQDKLVEMLKEYFKKANNQGVFSVVTFTISELLKDVKGYENVTYLMYDKETEDGEVTRKIPDQSMLFWGIFSDIDAAYDLIRKSLLRRIDDGTLYLDTAVTKPNNTATNDANGTNGSSIDDLDL